MEKNKIIKRAVAVMGTILVGTGTFAGGMALAEQQAQTKYEQRLEEEKKSAVDEYKLTIDIGYSEEEVEQREDLAREEGKQEGLTEGYEIGRQDGLSEGYNNGYNAGLNDGSGSSAGGLTAAQSELMDLYSTGKTKVVNLVGYTKLVSANVSGVKDGAYLHNTATKEVVKLMETGFGYNATTFVQENGQAEHFISSANSGVNGLWTFKSFEGGSFFEDIKMLFTDGYNYKVEMSKSGDLKVGACSSTILCFDKENQLIQQFTGSYSNALLEVGDLSFYVGRSNSVNVFGVNGSDIKQIGTISGIVRGYDRGGEMADYITYWSNPNTKFVKVTSDELIEMTSTIGSSTYWGVIGTSVVCRDSSGLLQRIDMEQDTVNELTPVGATVKVYSEEYVQSESGVFVFSFMDENSEHYLAILDGGYNVMKLTFEPIQDPFSQNMVVENAKDYVVVRYTSKNDGLTYQLNYTYNTGARELTVVE